MCHPASMQTFSYMYKIYTQLTVPSWYLVHVARTFLCECCFGNLSCNSRQYGALVLCCGIPLEIHGKLYIGDHISMPLECPLESFPNIARVLKSQLQYHISCLILIFQDSDSPKRDTIALHLCMSNSIHTRKYMSVLSVIHKYSLIHHKHLCMSVVLFMLGSMQSAIDKYIYTHTHHSSSNRIIM